ncbi:MAG: hypothetical protein IAI50_01705 [Candidatus Eremiobacteraeota bacterium]|nr:hypothetical protein [Candidatus Eremiobacteraeota bacterium]
MGADPGAAFGAKPSTGEPSDHAMVSPAMWNEPSREKKRFPDASTPMKYAPSGAATLSGSFDGLGRARVALRISSSCVS